MKFFSLILVVLSIIFVQTNHRCFAQECDEILYVNCDPSVSTTDHCYSSVKQAVDHLSETGGIVYVLPGTCPIDKSIILPSNVTLVGAGIGVTILMASPNLDGDVIENKSNDPCWNLDPCLATDSNITITNMTIDGIEYEGNAELSGIVMGGDRKYKIPAVRNLVIQNVQILNFDSSQGMTINGENVFIENCKVNNTKMNGMQVNGNKIHLTNNTYSNCRDNALEVGFARDVTISNCTFTENNCGLLVRNSRNVTVSNCVSKKNTGKGFWLWTADCTEICQNITIQGCITDSNYVGIQLYVQQCECEKNGEGNIIDGTCKCQTGHMRDITLEGNTVSCNTEGIRLRTDRYLVPYVSDQEIVGIQAVSIIDNIVRNNKYSSIYIANARNILLEGNLCYDNYHEEFYRTYHYDTDTESAAIFVYNSEFVTVIGNKCYDTRLLNPYQKYGYREIGEYSDSNWICMNDFSGCRIEWKKEYTNDTKFCETEWFDRTLKESPPTN